MIQWSEWTNNSLHTERDFRTRPQNTYTKVEPYTFVIGKIGG